MISIIIPTCEPKYYFYELIKSISDQTLDPSLYETIIIFNNTKLETVNNFSEYVKNNLLNYKILNIREPGVSLARNIGLEQTSMKYICFMDDDDIITSNYLEELLKVSNKNTLGVANVKTFTNDFLVQNSYFLTFYNDFEGRFSLKYKSNLSSVWGKLIHRDIIENFRFNENIKLGEDSLFMFLLSKNIFNIKSTNPNCLYLRRIRDNSTVTKKRSNIYYLKNFKQLCCEYTINFLLHPRSYGIVLYINRLMACFKSLILFILKKHE